MTSWEVDERAWTGIRPKTVDSWISKLNFYDLSMVDPEADLPLLEEGGMRDPSIYHCPEWLKEITGI